MADPHTASSTALGPTFPRRTLLAAGLSAVTAGGAVALYALGLVTAPRTDTFRFSRGTALATGEEARLRGVLAEALGDERIDVIIVGHTGSSGDAEANQDLSAERAEAVVDIARDIGLTRDRISATGVGGGDPLPKEEGEGDRAHQARLARVDVTLQVRR